jgi:tRNA (mo5U34)-methyltransferase
LTPAPRVDPGWGRPQPDDAERTAIRESRERRIVSFQDAMSALGWTDVRRHYAWYHAVRLTPEIQTPGVYDYEPVLPYFDFPEDMRGMSVLDVGAATGYFSFEFERRGAAVTAIELPSMAAWDMPASDGPRTLSRLMERHKVGSLAEVDYLHLEAPFDLCRALLKSRVRRRFSRVYDLSPETLGTDGYDFVFVGDVLLHLFGPLLALSQIARLCRGTLVVSQAIPDASDRQPSLLYVGGPEWNADGRTWWQPSMEFLDQSLRRLGFEDVRVAGRFGVLNQLDGFYNFNTVIHARKPPR